MKKVQLISKLTEFANTAYVHSRKITHAHGGVWDEYPCANPDGPVDNCIAQRMMICVIVPVRN